MSFYSNLLGSAGVNQPSTTYEISRSLRFNSSDSAYLSRTPSVAGNRKTWTWAGWVKRSALGVRQNIFGTSDASANNSLWIEFFNTDALRVVDYTTSIQFQIVTTQVFRDVSAWAHLVVSVDTTQGTASNRVKMYWNGLEITQFSTATYPGASVDTQLNTVTAHGIGRAGSYNAQYFNGYLADIHFIDGQALDFTSFGEFDTNGVWQPKAYTGTYTGNSFHLPFSDNSTAAALGTDTSGNSNTWTVNNISVTAGAGNDSLVDTPTNGSQTDTGVGGEVRGNYATLNPLSPPDLSSTGSLQNGNLEMVGTTNEPSTVGTIGVNTGKWYAECVFTAIKVGIDTQDIVGVQSLDALDSSTLKPLRITGSIGYQSEGEKVVDNSFTSYGALWGNNDVIGVAVDIDGNQITFYKNGVSQGTLSYTFSNHRNWTFGTGFGGALGTATYTWNFGQRPFAYTAPSGFKALCTANLDDPIVAQPSTVMDVALYTGNSGTQSITGLGFSPDFVWSKGRNATSNHALIDIVRGGDKVLISDVTDPEYTDSYIQSFDANGYTINSSSSPLNLSGNTYVAWTWDAGSSTASNPDGSIISTVRANPSAGFSIVSYTGDGAASATIGHGLNVAPQMIMVKNRDVADEGAVYHVGVDTTAPEDYFLKLFSTSNGTAARDNTGAMWNDTAPTSSVFSVGTEDNVNASTEDYIAYCFTGVDGYSNGFSYTGNGSADGSFVYLGFRPRLILLKCSSTTGNWTLVDTAREGYNVDNDPLYPNLSNAEGTTDLLDITSNGFKLRTTDASVNSSGATYIGFAWAELPFKTARAR